MHLLDYFNPDGPPTALFEIGPCPVCDGTGVQKDDRNCDCHVPILEGAGQHSPGCACFKPCPCGGRRSDGA